MISSDTESIVVVCAADNNYVIPLSVTLKSILVNLKTSQRITCFVIDGGIQEVNKQKILKSLDSQQIMIEWLQPTDAILSKVKVSGHVTVATYYRLLIPDLLPQHIEKVIYLDCDLVVNEDLQKLWAIEIDNSYLLAVQDMGIREVSNPRGGLHNYQELGIPPHSKYLNAGVMVFNLEKWRTENISTQAIEYLEQNKEHVLNWDQDGVNAVLAGKWRELDPRWNQTPSVYKYRSWKDSPFTEEMYKSVIQQPYIVHFATAIKPWHYYCEHPAKDLFFQYLDMTSWSGWRPKKPLKYIIRLGLRRFRENIKSLLKSFAWHLSLSR
ncbi:MAG: General stress protein A [Chroococcidiopsis cubana SAG 39.79]|uniref:Glycosyl transferase family 8 n=2 Tax=Chroococcidiopsis TaxID=54298 RepID=K9TYQ0_CHRTP|nr:MULTISPECIES: glycosyltransferase family 8 protein [Chroococcidiopsis]MBE9015493.1 glycosyltransferase family 8 protein [Chroococcidiopsidales cyanobacterium LEGE 13417]PSB47016.1 glycosyltransferase family 8 protein [Cyanosarcina cf. burmensis CCALA 770]AFY87962.1 glycosyl transferase family 8 [Chroococcidiopsis thermalis PCC 7203]MDZ4875545.1 General stress protein A [Chroococcidiopsis cubana SAG 39.79]PSB65205.1 glycosyltransferase family 8 protein [Chroococcidiopsis cubana CCALA 043]